LRSVCAHITPVSRPGEPCQCRCTRRAAGLRTVVTLPPSLPPSSALTTTTRAAGRTGSAVLAGALPEKRALHACEVTARPSRHPMPNPSQVREHLGALCELQHNSPAGWQPSGQSGRSRRPPFCSPSRSHRQGPQARTEYSCLSRSILSDRDSLEGRAGLRTTVQLRWSNASGCSHSRHPTQACWGQGRGDGGGGWC